MGEKISSRSCLLGLGCNRLFATFSLPSLITITNLVALFQWSKHTLRVEKNTPEGAAGLKKNFLI